MDTIEPRKISHAVVYQIAWTVRLDLAGYGKFVKLEHGDDFHLIAAPDLEVRPRNFD